MPFLWVDCYHPYQNQLYNTFLKFSRTLLFSSILLLDLIYINTFIFLNLMQTDLNYKVYWERQGVDSLCGVHCINSLLQGPHFDEIQLSEMALELDRKEKQLMGQMGMTSDYMKFLGQESGNVALDGNYSIQVLQEALKKLNLHVVSIETINEKAHLNDKIGFICNSSSHWIAIRKVKNTWYNLNSLGMRLPEIISDFYLSAFLVAIKQSGYQIFSVEGDFPSTKQQDFQHYNSHQEWYPAKRILKYHQKKSKRKGYKPNISGGSDKSMEKAIAMSLGKKYQEYVSSGEDSDWQNDKPKLKPFHGKGYAMESSQVQVLYEKFEMDPHDPQLIMIVKMTLEQKFNKEPKEGLAVIFRFPDGKKQRRLFQRDCTLQTVYDYLWMKRNPGHKFYLMDLMTKQKLTELYLPLESLVDPEDQEMVVNIVDI